MKKIKVKAKHKRDKELAQSLEAFVDGVIDRQKLQELTHRSYLDILLFGEVSDQTKNMSIDKDK